MAGVEDHLTKSAKTSPAIPSWMWGALAALLLFTIYQTWEMSRLRSTIEQTSQQAKDGINKRVDLKEQFAILQREAAILTDPHSVKIPMLAGDKNLGEVKAMWHSKLGLVVAGQNVPMPSGNRTLQLWLIPKTPGGKPIPSITLRPDADGKFLFLVANPPETIDATKALIITEEPASGGQAPIAKTIWLGSIR